MEPDGRGAGRGGKDRRRENIGGGKVEGRERGGAEGRARKRGKESTKRRIEWNIEAAQPSVRTRNRNRFEVCADR